MAVLSRTDARVKLLCLVAYIIATLHAHTPLALGICALAAAGVAAAAHLRGRDVVRILRPIAVILVVTVIMQVLSIRQGAVLVVFGPIEVTVGALSMAARMVVSLLCVMVMSVAFMRFTRSEELARTFDWLLAPLRRAGVRTDGLTFSLSVAFRFVPVLVSDFDQIKRAQLVRGASFEGGVRKRLSAYTRLFAPLVRSSFRRADTLAAAACARGMGATVCRSSLHRGRFGIAEVVCIAVTVALVICAFAL